MRILVVDDDTLVLKSLDMILKSEGFEEVETAVDRKTAIEKYQKSKFDVVLQDIRMKEENGIDIATNILEIDKDAKIILLTTFKDEEYINKAIKSGVKGYILKDNIDTLSNLIKTVLDGNMVLDAEIISDIKIGNTALKNIEKLGISEREMELIKLISEGMNNKEISKVLFLSEGTVRNYISKILEKLNLRDRSQIVVFYYKNLA